ncbi:hypothetical protein ULF88_23695 [Halopseudomonas pachastrellae]|nr:hypothetical protein [Halopseudomonas pachastrellae]
MEGFTDVVTGQARRGFMEVVSELEQKFPDPSAIEKESEKKEFAKLFGEYLRVENILQNYDEFASLKALQNVDMSDPEAVEAFKAEHYLDDEKAGRITNHPLACRTQSSGLSLNLQRHPRLAAPPKIS